MVLALGVQCRLLRHYSHGTEKNMNNDMQTGVYTGDVYSTLLVDRIWGMWGSYYNVPKAI